VTSPRAFLCHATPDKDIYVVPFGKYLASKGINPWVDDWEIKLGDSLLTKVESGIGEADYFLPFLTPRSADRPWVRSEIEMAVARKMLSKLRILPILIGVSVQNIPLFFQTILGVKVEGEEGISAAAQQVVDTIYGVSTKPAIAAQPAYAATPTLRGFTPADMTFLRAACEQSIEADQPEIDFDGVVERLKDSGLSEQTMKDCAAVLSERGYLKLEGVIGNPYMYLEVRPIGFDAYATAFITEYESLYRRIAVMIAGAPDYNPSVDAGSIARALEVDHRIVNHVYEHLAIRGKITLSKAVRRSHEAMTVSASFRREMSGG
jgi:TIR domain